jgi:hypothetical protein
MITHNLLPSLVMLAGLTIFPTMARADISFTLPLTTDNTNKLDLGLFAAGTSLTFAVSGHGDIVNANFQVNPDGSLFVAALAPYGFANPGAAYPTKNGGDGTNHFLGGGANYDPISDIYGFTGLLTTDTTNPGAIRFGAVVGTLNASPTRNDWFLIGSDKSIVIPAGGAHVYLAVNDGFNSNNHGVYSGTVLVTAVPEPSTCALVAAATAGVGFQIRRRKASK